MQYLKRVVSGCIVQDDELKISQGLVKDAVNGLRYVTGAIVDGHYNADLR
jgi:hypothetical protein